MKIKVWLIVGCAVAVIVASIWGAGTAVEKAYEKGLADASATMSKERLKVEFDRGMKAGVEYEQWFCKNAVDTDTLESEVEK